jgi:hypothetical protein
VRHHTRREGRASHFIAGESNFARRGRFSVGVVIFWTTEEGRLFAYDRGGDRHFRGLRGESRAVRAITAASRTLALASFGVSISGFHEANSNTMRICAL